MHFWQYKISLDWVGPTYRLSINGLHLLAVAIQAAVDVGGVLAIKPEQIWREAHLNRGSADRCTLIC